MNFFSPDRPRLANGLPRHLEHNFALPSLQLTILPDHLFELGAMVPGSRNGYKWVQTEVDIRTLSLILTHYREDPEKALEEHFGFDFYEPIVMAEPMGTETLALSDLEDLF